MLASRGGMSTVQCCVSEVKQRETGGEGRGQRGRMRFFFCFETEKRLLACCFLSPQLLLQPTSRTGEDRGGGGEVVKVLGGERWDGRELRG